MTAREERPAGRRWGKKTRVWAAAITVAALAAGVGVFVAVQPERVDPSSVKNTPQAEQVALNEQMPGAPSDTDFTAAAVDVTDELSIGFNGDLRGARTRWTEKQVDVLMAQPDQCLLDWAFANLGELATTGTYAVVEVCGRPTAVLAGPAGSDTKVMSYAALEDDAPEQIREVLLESDTNRMAFSAVRSADGEAQLIAAAALPEVDASELVDEDGNPPVINVRPPGVEIAK